MKFNIVQPGQNKSQQRIDTHAARAKWRKENPPGTRIEFIGVDGEGVTFPDGTHRYVLLGIGDEQISAESGLSWQQCFEFLYDFANTLRGKPVAYVGFFLGYDFTQMLRSLPENRARMLLTAEGRMVRKPRSKHRPMPFPVSCDGWQFDILGTKRLKFRPKTCDCFGNESCEHVKGVPWMYICDSGSFFQKSFLKVIDPREWSDPIVSQEVYRDIERGKSKRSVASLDEDMRRYNRLENETLAKVMARLAKGFQELDIYLKPNQWFGPGQAAQEWLSTRAISNERLQEVVPYEVLECARKSYFGGWFEIMAHGTIPGITWEYDINSAYPYIISELPCLEHGTWDRNQINRNFCLVYAKVKSNNPYIGSMLHRDSHGNISRPMETEGWYWLDELETAKTAGCISKMEIVEAWSYFPCDCPSPLQEVRDIYNLRKKVGKKTPLGIACKLVPNSLYGKFAQSVGSPKYANPLYASRITSGCRRMILEAIASHPQGLKAVLMVATDGVYFSSKHPSVTLSGELGEWEEDQKHNITLFKPGVYWDDKAREQIKNGDAPVFKARGVNARDFGSQLAEIDAMFHVMSKHRAKEIQWPSVVFPLSFSMITAVQALQRNNWRLAGTIVRDPVSTQSSCPVMKRELWTWDDECGILRSRPIRHYPYEASKPYEKRFGIEDPFSQESEESHGITPDGLPQMLWREMMGYE